MSESEIFNAAVKLNADERPAYLDRACQGNSRLRDGVESLLQAHDASCGFLRQVPTAPEPIVEHGISEHAGTIIGPYKLMEQIGEGGFGLVFVAEQQQPVRRKVALKIIKPGMDTRDVIARFEAERQALALMDHPNIARVFDGGTTSSGRPYFVMELVKGIPIVDYCDQQQLTARERLELFISVCQAVQHAHAKGIIHRDLKPSNVLVAPHDGVPVVKVIDFGVAKAIGQQLTEKTIYTRFAQMIGTPLYMSPEQAEINALDVDIRSDVYSLGVLLYELLTGTTPFDRQRFQKAAYDEIRRIIKEEEPPRPSTRLSTMGESISKISLQRKTEPAKLSAFVKGDLDWIVMKALEKDRKRRYETAIGLAKDVERYLANEPVEACPPSLGYKARKFVSRNRGPVIVSSTMALLLLFGLGGTITGIIHARLALQQMKVSEAVALAERDAKEIARQAEAEQRQVAQQERDNAELAREDLRRALYASNMNLLQTAWETNNTSRALELLDATRPAPGENDLRGFEWHYWHRLAHAELKSFKLDFGPETKRPRNDYIAFSANGEVCAAITRTAAGVPLVKAWNAASGNELFTFPAEDSDTMGIYLSGNGERLALAIHAKSDAKEWERQIFVWSIAEKKLVKTIKVPNKDQRQRIPTSDIRPVLSHNGRWLVMNARGEQGAGSLPGVAIWDMDGQTDNPFQHHDIPSGAVLSPDGSQLVTLGLLRDKEPLRPVRFELRIRDTATGKVIRTAPWPAPPGPETVVGPTHLSSATFAISPDGSRLAAIQYHRAFPSVATLAQGVVWNNEGKILAIFDPQIAIAYICFSPDGKLLATWSGGRNPIGKLWKTSTGELVQTWKGSVAPVFGIGFSKDSSKVFAVDLDGILRTWDASADPPRRGAVNTNTFVIWSLDGTRQAQLGRGVSKNAIVICDASGRQLFEFKGHKEQITGVQLNFSGSHALSTDRSRNIKLWSAATGKVLLELPGQADDNAGLQTRTAPRFSDNGRRLAINMPGGQVRVWDIGNEARELFTCEDRPRSSTLSPDGKYLLTMHALDLNGEPNREATIWDVDRGSKCCVFTGKILGMVFSPDGSRIAGRLAPKARSLTFTALNIPVEIKVWETATGKEVAHLDKDLAFGSVAFSPDNRRLAATAHSISSSVGDILVWDLATAKQVLRLKGHSTTPNGMVYSPDGTRIVSSAQPVDQPYGELKLWDAATGTELLALKPAGLLNMTNLLAFSADGQKLITAGNPAIWVQIWEGGPR